MNGLSLFSGIGGLDLAFEWAGGKVKAMCEIEPYCQKVLRKHWPHVPLFEDIRELRSADVGKVDIIYGGFPCQPFSVAGNRKGQDDDRYLWPEFSKLVSEIKPRWVLAENVPGILRIAADDVCSDLERQGYCIGIWDFEAAAVGAKHRRERIFFVAHSGRSLRQRGFEQRTLRDEIERGTAYQPERPSCSPAPYSDSKRCEEQRESIKLPETHAAFGCCGWWESEPRMDRTSHGISYRVDRLRALVNAVVPQQAYPVFKAIKEADDNAEAI